ncbi:hypothetical protein [Deinococcus hohokamensis]|uniref:Uncharacterized protein n=1 Tax=Deinococcus hohokamensis TaxID=309883 RepID=A0ABV9I3N9_9DEIO
MTDNPFSRAVTLRSGLTITVEAWPYKRFAACYTNFRNLLQAARETAGFENESEYDLQQLLDRVVLESVPEESDRVRIQTPDLEALIDAIEGLNNVRGVVAKLLSSYAGLLRAEADSLESQFELTSTTLPT